MGELYDRIWDFDNLYHAYRLTARGKRYEQEKLRFEMDLGTNLTALAVSLKEGTYHPHGYRTFMVTEPKQRMIHASAFPDRIVQHSLCDNVLRDWLERRLIYDCAACRTGKGTHFAIKRLTRFMSEHYRKYGCSGYILRIDVRKYFDNIDHGILKTLFAGFPDTKVRDLIYTIIDSYDPFGEGKGLPLGNQTSQWFSLYYLDEMDRMIKEKMKIRGYSRYMDDMVLIHESKDYLKECLGILESFAENRRKITFNAKTQIFPISQGADYLGWHFYLTESGKVIRKLRTGNKKRMKRRLRAYRKQYETGMRDFEDIRQRIISTEAHLAHGHTYCLRRHIHRDLVFHSRSGHPSET